MFPKLNSEQPRDGDLRLTGSSSRSNPLALAADPETHCLAEIICIELSFRPLFQEGDTMRCVTGENQLSYILAAFTVFGWCLVWRPCEVFLWMCWLMKGLLEHQAGHFFLSLKGSDPFPVVFFKLNPFWVGEGKSVGGPCLGEGWGRPWQFRPDLNLPPSQPGVTLGCMGLYQWFCWCRSM